MGFQFIREECYSRVRSQGAPSRRNGKARKGTGKLSAREVIAEAIRAVGATPHVTAPQPPRSLYGLPAEDLPIWLDQIESMAHDVKVQTAHGERRQRSDTPILLGVVASYPAKADEGDPLYVAWRERTIEFFKLRYGSLLVSVLEHTDEPFGHLHAEITNLGMSVKTLHAGHSAMRESAKRGDTKKMQSDAYKDGARRLQDDFFKAVSIESGLARIGPKKRRKTRAQWQAEKQANIATAIGLLREHERFQEATIRACNANVLMDKAERRAERVARDAEFAQRHQAAERERLAEERAEINGLQQSNRAKEKELASALADASVIKLRADNDRLKQHVSRLSAMVTAELAPQSSGHYSAGLSSPIFRKP